MLLKQKKLWIIINRLLLNLKINFLLQKSLLLFILVIVMTEICTVLINRRSGFKSDRKTVGLSFRPPLGKKANSPKAFYLLTSLPFALRRSREATSSSTRGTEKQICPWYHCYYLSTLDLSRYYNTTTYTISKL